MHIEGSCNLAVLKMIRTYICCFVALFFVLGLFGCTEQQAQPVFVRVVALSDGAMVPDAEMDRNGVVHLAYIADGDVYYKKSLDEGESFSEPLRVNTEEGFAFGGRYAGPDIAIGDQGVIHLVWDNAAHQQRRPPEEWGVMYARLLPGKTTFEAERNLTQQPGENFAIAANGSGEVSIIWMADSLYISTSRDGGDVFESAVAMPVDQCECCGSRALYSEDGRLFFLYRDKADNIRDMHLASVGEGASPFTQTKLSQTPWHIDGCPMTGSFLTHNEKTVLAGWETEGEVFIGEVDIDTPSVHHGEIKVAERGKYPVALRAGDGSTVVAWKSGSQLIWQRVEADGTLPGIPDSIEVSSPHRPGGVVTHSGNILLFP